MGAAFRPGWNSSELGPVFICVDDILLFSWLLQLCHFRAKGAGSVKGEDLDDEESADEGDDGDFTVYECPGLAPVSWSSTWGQLQMSCYCQAKLNSINWAPHWHCDSTVRLKRDCTAFVWHSFSMRHVACTRIKFDVWNQIVSLSCYSVSILDSIWCGRSTAFETGLVS